MTLTDKDLFLLTRCAIAAAYQAGHLISEYSQQEVTVKQKTGGDSLASQVVTEVDLKSQEMILTHLSPTCSMYDLALLTEETTDDLDRLEKNYFWCIDPLDGTLPFIESTPGYSVSIALVTRQGEPLIGVIYDPVTKKLYHATKGTGAYCNLAALKTFSTNKSKVTPLTIIIDRSFKKHALFSECMDNLYSFAEKSGYNGAVLIDQGGAAMNACWVLENYPACYVKLPKPEPGGGSLWDFAASACICKEAGIVAGDINGKPLDLNRPDSTFMNHRGILYASDEKLAKGIMENL